MKILFRGILLCVGLAVLSVGLDHLAPVLGKVLICLLLGTALRSLWDIHSDFKPGIEFCAKNVLAAAVVLMGLKLKAEILMQIGPLVFLSMGGVVAVSISAAALLYRALNLDRATALLIGIGSGICGSSAIATCSRFITDSDSKVATSLGVINFVGLLSFAAISIVAKSTGISESHSSLLIGGLLQSLGHVAAAGGVLGPVVLSGALTIKMGRVVLLVPTVIALSLLTKKTEGNPIKKIPYYLWGFIGAMVLTNLPFVPDPLVAAGARLGDYLLMVAVVGIGFGIDLRTFFRQAPKLILLAIILQVLELIVLLPILL